jgi:hypothetical protein
MFTLIKLAFQVVFKPYSLNDKTSCKKFIENILTLIKPLAAANKITIDETLLNQLEKILANDALFDYFFDLVKDQISNNDVLFESADESAIVSLCETSKARTQMGENMPEAINPIVVISLVTQMISLINAMKQFRMNQ